MSNLILTFILGAMFGACAGMFIMCLCIAAKDNHDDEK